MIVKYTEIYSILKIIFNIMFGFIVLILSIPFLVFGFVYYFIKFLIQYEVNSKSQS